MSGEHLPQGSVGLGGGNGGKVPKGMGKSTRRHFRGKEQYSSFLSGCHRKEPSLSQLAPSFKQDAGARKQQLPLLTVLLLQFPTKL